MKKKIKKTYVIFVVFVLFFIHLTNTYAYSTGDDYPSKYKNANISSIVDEWNFYNRQCTSFVAWCLNSRNGVSFTNQYGGVSRWGNANEWHTAAKSLGISVNTTPAVGAVAYWSSNHVAWVKSVSGSNITIEEYNYGYSGKYNSRTISASNPTGYIHIKDIADDPAPIPDEPVIKASAKYAKESTSVTVSWSKDSKAAKYEYFLAEYPKAYAYTTNSGHGFTTDTSIKFSNLACGNYSVFIHGISKDGERSSQSNWVTFEINADDYIPKKVVIYNNHIYALYEYVTTWTFANDLCVALGGHLATVTSSAENAVVTDLVQAGSDDTYWLGASAPENSDKDYQWVTGESFSYSNWMSGQPSASGEKGTKQRFLEIVKSYDYQWNDVKNTNKKGFILEIDTGEYSPVATQTYNGSQYLLFDKNTTWSEAQVFCEVLGGHLAYANTEEENEFIKTFVKNGQRGWYYLGGQKINGVWKWADGSKADAITWAPTADSWTGTNLMMYKSHGTCIGLRNAYYPKANLDIMGFVCEIEAGDEPTPTSMPTPTPTVTTTPTPTPTPTPMPIPAPACFTVDYGDGYADITNISDSMQTAAVITAEYSGGVLVSVNAGNVTFAAGEKRSIIINNNTKVFVWDSLKGMKPLAK